MSKATSSEILELTRKAADDAGFLAGDLRDLVRKSAEHDPLLHLLATDLLEAAAKIESRLAMIDLVQKETSQHSIGKERP